MTSRQYVYRITEVVKVTDGDTWWLRVDCGLGEVALREFRLDGYDTPEKRSSSTRKVTDAEKAAAAHASELSASLLVEWMSAEGSSVLVRTEKDPEKYGRWLGDLWVESDSDEWPERHLGVELRSVGLASVWPTRWYQEYT